MKKENKIQLTKGVEVEISYAAPTTIDGTEFRTILDILSHIPDKNRLIKHYEIWVTEEYLEDHAKLSPDLKGAKKFALKFIKKRFKESGDVIPQEDGVRCMGGKCQFGNPQTFWPEIIQRESLEEIEKESEQQERPDQKAIVTVSPKLRKRLHNLPDSTNPPLGWDDHKAFGAVYPYLKVPSLHPRNHSDTVIFNASDQPPNKLYLGDNLEVLRTLPSNSIDLIYIDPPFFSGREYNVIWGDSNEIRTFNDIWEGGITSYLIWLNARLWEMRRVLKKTGSIYVHCDWHASHYIKTEMDKIFGY